MKKIFLCAVVTAALACTAAAENLYRLVPAGTAATLRIRIEALLEQPLLKELAARSGEVEKAVQKIEKLSTESGAEEVQLKEALYVFVNESRWCVFMECSGLTESNFRTMLLREYPKAREVTIAGRTAYITETRSDIGDVATMFFQEGLIVAGQVNELANLLNSPKMAAADADRYNEAKELLVLDVMDCTMLNALVGDPQAGIIFSNVRGSGTIDGQLVKFRVDAGCGNEAAARNVANQIQQMLILGISMGMTADPALAQQILQRLKVEADGSAVSVNVAFTREMLTAAAEYKNKSQEMRKQRRELRRQQKQQGI